MCYCDTVACNGPEYIPTTTTTTTTTTLTTTKPSLACVGGLLCNGGVYLKMSLLFVIPIMGFSLLF